MKSRTKQATTTSVTSTSTKPSICEGQKQYPSISAAYWLPAPNTTPYLLPGIVEKNCMDQSLSFLDFPQTFSFLPFYVHQILKFPLIPFIFFLRTKAIRWNAKQEV